MLVERLFDQLQVVRLKPCQFVECVFWCGVVVVGVDYDRDPVVERVVHIGDDFFVEFGAWVPDFEFDRAEFVLDPVVQFFYVGVCGVEVEFLVDFC